MKFSKDFDKHELSYSFLSKCEHITGNIQENKKSKLENVSYESKIILRFLRHQRELQRNLNLVLFVERDELMWLGGKISSLTDDNHRLIINLYENELIKTVNQINTIQDKGYQKEYLFLVKDYKFMFFE